MRDAIGGGFGGPSGEAPAAVGQGDGCMRWGEERGEVLVGLSRAAPVVKKDDAGKGWRRDGARGSDEGV